MKNKYQELPWERQATRIVVVGDLILDEYLDGVVNRISPEAPVPVHLVRHTSITAGGAANVARNIQLVGGQATITGVCGNDGAADQLKQILKKDKIEIDNILTDFDRPTVRKTRITANHQQLVRVDWEEVKPISDNIQKELLTCLEQEEFHAILVSDYGKGGLPQSFLKSIIALGQLRGVPVVVDPKGKDYSVYSGCNLITPNRNEACEALGLDPTKSWEPEVLARELRQRYHLKDVLVTLGAEGMCGLSDKDERCFRLPAVTREVFDVSGAGDTVVSVMALCIASGEPLDRAMRFANIAAGKVVEKWGTQPIQREELIEALQEDSLEHSRTWRSSIDKIVPLDSLMGKIGLNGQRRHKIVFTNGCFDILHAGHVNYLEEARSLGDMLVVGVNSDRSVRGLKGPSRPIIPEEQRLRLLAALGCIDFVVCFDEETPAQLIERILPDVLVKGADYQISEIVGAKAVHSAGGVVKTLPYVAGLSTSDIVARVKLDQGVSI